MNPNAVTKPVQMCRLFQFMYTVYILYSVRLNKFYIGFTADSMETRLSKHLANHNGFTSKAKDWKIAYTETFESKPEAMHREKQIKGWKSQIRLKKLMGSSSTE